MLDFRSQRRQLCRRLLPVMFLLTLSASPALSQSPSAPPKQITPVPSSETIAEHLDRQFPMTAFFSEMVARFRNPSRPAERYQFVRGLPPALRELFYQMCLTSERFELFEQAANKYIEKYPARRPHVESLLAKLKNLLAQTGPFTDRGVMLLNGGEYHVNYYNSLSEQEKVIRHDLVTEIMPPSLYLSRPSDTFLSPEGVRFFQTFAAAFPSANNIIQVAQRKKAISTTRTNSQNNGISDGIFVQSPRRMQGSAGCICISDKQAAFKCGSGNKCGGYGRSCTPLTEAQGGDRCGGEGGTAPCTGVCEPSGLAQPIDSAS